MEIVNNRKGILIFSLCIIISLSLVTCNENAKKAQKELPKPGKYLNMHNDVLYIYSSQTYKSIKEGITTIGEWNFFYPNEIGFKNWQDSRVGHLDYKFGFVDIDRIIFDLDNEPNNYYLQKP